MAPLCSSRGISTTRSNLRANPAALRRSRTCRLHVRCVQQGHRNSSCDHTSLSCIGRRSTRASTCRPSCRQRRSLVPTSANGLRLQGLREERPRRNAKSPVASAVASKQKELARCGVCVLVVSTIVKPQPKPGTSQGVPRAGKREAREHAWTSTGTRPEKAPRAKNAGFSSRRRREQKKRWLFAVKAPRV